MEKVCRAVLGLLSMLFFISCVSYIPEFSEEGVEDDDCQEVTVRFDLKGRSMTKSSIAPSEDSVNDLNLYAFCDGKLISQEYFEQGSQLELKLLYGHSYNLYALANMGQIEAPIDEEDFTQSCRYEIAEHCDIGQVLPMSWSSDGFIVDSWADRVTIDLERLVAKVVFSIDKTALKGLEINAVRLCQSAAVVWPFKYMDGSHVVGSDEVLDGDYASAEDLDILNDGGQVSFYVLENCHGDLLPGNDDPWAKVPDNIAEQSTLCTYLEVDCTFREGYFYSGDVTYRMYLGTDGLSNFDVRRNSLLNVLLYLTDDALREVSWRVDAEVSVNGGYANGWQSEGLHSVDNLYVGERFVYSVAIKDEMLAHVNGDVEALRLCVLDADGEMIGNQLFDCGGFVRVDYDEGLTYYDVDVLCCHPGEGVLGLIDDNDEILALFDDVLVQKPRLRPSDYPQYNWGDIVQADVGLLVLPINASARKFYVYLIDNDGYNLNVSDGCGFELSLFDLSCESDGVESQAENSLEFWPVGGENSNDGPLATVNARSVNDGCSSELNNALIRWIRNADTAELILKENNLGITGALEYCVENLPIELTLVDNGWAGYADCQLSMLVDNQSRLPVDVQCWQINTGNDDYNAIYRNEIVGLYGVEFIRNTYDYVCGSYPSESGPIYCSKTAFTAVESGAYPLWGLSTTNIRNALLYDYMGQEALSHHVDVQFDGGGYVPGLNIKDSLSDGSMQYEIIYGNDSGNDGWNNRGIWLYSAGKLLSKPGREFDFLQGVIPGSLSAISSGNMGHISVGYDANTQNLYAFVSTVDLVGVKFNAEIVVNASGYVQTTPNGTWGKKVDNYCTSKVSKQVKDISLSASPVAVDDGAIKEAMNAIYAQAFFDSYNSIGSANSYQHCAHPTSLEVSLRFSLSGDSAMRMIPITVSTPVTVHFYHTQEAVTYSVTVDTSKKINKMAFVTSL